MQKESVRLEGLEQVLDDFIKLNEDNLKELNPHFTEENSPLDNRLKQVKKAR